MVQVQLDNSNSRSSEHPQSYYEFHSHFTFGDQPENILESKIETIYR